MNLLLLRKIRRISKRAVNGSCISKMELNLVIFSLIYYIALLICGIISLIFYCTFIIFILKMLKSNNPNFSKEFYQIFVIGGIVDILYVAGECVVWIIGEISLFQNFYLKICAELNAASILSTLSMSQGFLSAFFVIIISFNRFTSVYFPFQYNNMWKSWKLSLLVGWPFAIVIPFFHVQFVLNTETNTLSLTYEDENISNFLWQCNAIVHFAATILAGTMNFLLLKKIKSIGKITANGNHISKTEFNLAIFSLVSFSIILGYCQLFFLVGLGVLGPYALFIISKKVRNNFLVFIKIRKNTVIITSNQLAKNNVSIAVI
uniref:G_PROTEIN_RECEP_F1_2 domain-containing protein n=1 Tax=Rhabditophanes sp. KR3021 TaxID=114890 RepID=A0AC35U8Y3_9BILA